MKGMYAVLGLLAILAVASQCTATAATAAFPVNVNTAGMEQLMDIPGIGSAKAKAIMEYRQQKPFGSTAELTNVKGIGERLLAKITPYVTVSGKTSSVRPGTGGK